MDGYGNGFGSGSALEECLLMLEVEVYDTRYVYDM